LIEEFIKEQILRTEAEASGLGVSNGKIDDLNDLLREL